MLLLITKINFELITDSVIKIDVTVIPYSVPKCIVWRW